MHIDQVYSLIIKYNGKIQTDTAQLIGLMAVYTHNTINTIQYTLVPTCILYYNIKIRGSSSKSILLFDFD